MKLDPLAFSRKDKKDVKLRKSVDIDSTAEEKQKARILQHIDDSDSVDKLYEVASLVSEYDLGEEYQAKFDELNEG